MSEVDLTQLNNVLKYMRSGKAINTWDARDMFGATRLSAIIWVLRHKRGIDVKDRWVTGINRYGNESRWKEFYIEEE